MHGLDIFFLGILLKSGEDSEAKLICPAKGDLDDASNRSAVYSGVIKGSVYVVRNI
jgi:hypothetical protein